MKAVILKLVAVVENILTFAVVFLSRQRFDTKRYRFNVPEVWYSPWNENAEFNKLYDSVCNNTLISKRKLFDLYNIGGQVNRCVNGTVLEVGTYRGGSAGLLASIFPQRPLVLWDIWNKIVEQDHSFVKKVYSASDDLHQARQLLLNIGSNSAINAVYIDDIFPNSTIFSKWESGISLIHFDIYDSAAFALGIKLLWPQLLAGGVFVVGGYGSISLDSLTDAVNEFVNENHCFFVTSQSGMGLIFKQYQN